LINILNKLFKLICRRKKAQDTVFSERVVRDLNLARTRISKLENENRWLLKQLAESEENITRGNR